MSDSTFTKIIHKLPYDAIDPKQASLSAAGKTLLITAGHTGIGFAIAQNFAAAGASHIILVARRLAVLETAAKELSTQYPQVQFHHFAASLTDQAEIKKVFAQIRSEISSHIDILITSAAYAPPPSTALDLSLDEIRKAFDTNLVGNINLVQEFVADASGKEKIILDLATIASYKRAPYLGAYGTSKLAFTQWLANVQQDMESKGLRIHSFHPGSVLTDAARGFGMTEDSLDWDNVQVPGRFAVWLASEEAVFLKGRFVWATWDVKELMERKAEIESHAELLKVGLQLH